MNYKKIKKLLVLLFIMVTLVLFIIVYFIINKLKPEEQDDNTTDLYSTTKNGEVDLYTPDEVEEKEDIWEEDTDSDITQEESKLTVEDDKFTYFLMKQCITKFYNVQSKESAVNLVDKEVIEKLGINQDNISQLFVNINSPQICIDGIYKQKIDASKNIYVVYHRLIKNTQSNTELIDSALLVKIDEKNVDFSIYPYEYLKKYNFINLKENDNIKIDNLDEINPNDDNEYRTNDISKDNQTTISELFERFKFDLNYDNENLYNTIDDEYKKIYFSNLDEFEKYLNKKRETLNSDKLTKYQVNKLNNYIQYIGIADNDNHYIFKAKNIMNYKLLLDNYSTVLPQYLDLYYSNFPNVQGKYCIDRFIKSINDKNYEFAYSKILDVQKNNYYPQLEDFEKTIKEELFEKNNYKVDNIITISETVYQYTVSLSDKKKESTENKTLIATVTLRNNADFYIAFKIK